MPKRPSGDYPSPHAEPLPDTVSLTDTPPLTTITPLSIILEVMRGRYAAKDFDAAIALAKIAAPYLHPRATAVTVAPDLTAMHDADLEQLSPSD